MWTGDEASAFLSHVATQRLGPLWRLALATGLRRGELLGLRWSDMDLATARLTVAQARVTAGTVTTGRPKTKAGSRVVALDPETVATLRGWERR